MNKGNLRYAEKHSGGSLICALPSVFRGAEPGLCLEKAAEIRIVVETAHSGELTDRHFQRTLLPVGDRVTGLGGGAYREYIVMTPKKACLVPDNLKDEDAIAEPLACLLSAAMKLPVETLGDTCAVVGCGMISYIYIKNLKNLFSVIDLVSVCDMSSDTAREKSALFGESPEEGVVYDMTASFTVPRALEPGHTDLILGGVRGGAEAALAK